MYLPAPGPPLTPARFSQIMSLPEPMAYAATFNEPNWHQYSMPDDMYQHISALSGATVIIIFDTARGISCLIAISPQEERFYLPEGLPAGWHRNPCAVTDATDPRERTGLGKHAKPLDYIRPEHGVALNCGPGIYASPGTAQLMTKFAGALRQMRASQGVFSDPRRVLGLLVVGVREGESRPALRGNFAEIVRAMKRLDLPCGVVRYEVPNGGGGGAANGVKGSLVLESNGSNMPPNVYVGGEMIDPTNAHTTFVGRNMGAGGSKSEDVEPEVEEAD